jgi:two-component system chemotaxis response regulator CheY
VSGTAPNGAAADAVRARIVLVVDDHESIRLLVRSALEGEGYVVVEAADGAEALRVTRATPPQLILLDWNMPVVNGPDFAAAYFVEPGPHAPIVLITAALLAGHRAAELGAVGFLTKPFSLGALVATVARFVGAVSPPR